MSDFDANEWIRELRKRLHEQGNHISVIEGQMLADRMVAEERHRQVESTNRDIKSDISHLSILITAQGKTMAEIDQGQKSILQTMESDRKTRIETAKALEDADKARQARSNEPWVTPNRVIMLALGVAGIVTYIQEKGGA